MPIITPRCQKFLHIGPLSGFEHKCFGARGAGLSISETASYWTKNFWLSWSLRTGLLLKHGETSELKSVDVHKWYLVHLKNQDWLWWCFSITLNKELWVSVETIQMGNRISKCEDKTVEGPVGEISGSLWTTILSEFFFISLCNSRFNVTCALCCNAFNVLCNALKVVLHMKCANMKKTCLI